MALRHYLLVLTILLIVTVGNAFNMKYVMDRLNAIEAKFDAENQRRRAETDALERKFETENNLRRLEVEELLRIISQLTGGQMVTKTEDVLSGQNITPNQLLTTVSPSLDKYTTTQNSREFENLQSSLIRGAEVEKEENIKIRTELKGISKRMENDYAIFRSNIIDEIRNITNNITKKQILVLNETRQSLSSFKYDSEASILDLSNRLHKVNQTSVESMERCYNFSGSLKEQTASVLSEVRNETRLSLTLFKSDVQASIRELSSVLHTVNQALANNTIYIGSCKNTPKLNGIYNINYTKSATPVRVYCDQETDGGAWLVIQRRKDGSVDFYRNWADYKTGFGDIENEFWIGNDILHFLTSSGLNELRIDMMDFEGNKVYAKYSYFKVHPESDLYKLEVGGYSGDAGDALRRHYVDPFSTKDRDNDMWYGGSCSEIWRGAWWYGSCANANLNGRYYHGGNSHHDGIFWYDWKISSYSLKTVEMKIR